MTSSFADEVTFERDGDHEIKVGWTEDLVENTSDALPMYSWLPTLLGPQDAPRLKIPTARIWTQTAAGPVKRQRETTRMLPRGSFRSHIGCLKNYDFTPGPPGCAAKLAGEQWRDRSAVRWVTSDGGPTADVQVI